jgi:hydroxylaminobenzene mutase
MLLIFYSSFDGFAIPFLRSERIGLSVHTLSAFQGVFLLAQGLFWPRLKLGVPHGLAEGSPAQETFIKVLAYSSAPTGLVAFALMLWGLRVDERTA